MKKLLPALIVLILTSCSDKSTFTYFGGEIVNPKEDYVYLQFQDQLIDSVRLDDNNRFQFKLQDPSEGVYTFHHERELQYFIIEKQDSLMLRLNTLEFDESLVFSGNGSEKNNFLIDMYLLMEDEEYMMRTFLRASPEQFLRKVDSLRAMKIDEYEELISENELSPLAKEVTKASIDYPHYYNKEKYAMEAKFNPRLEKQPRLPQNYFEHRETINLNDEYLAGYAPYISYLSIYLDDLTKNTCQVDCNLSGKLNAYHYSTHRLNLVDSLVTYSPLRSQLMERTAFVYFRWDHDIENNKKFMDEYRAITDGEVSPDLQNMQRAVANLRSGATFPEFELYDPKGVKHTIDSTWFDQNTVFYLWMSAEKRHAKKIAYHMKKLEKEFPKFKFVSINLDADQQQWLNSMEELGLEKGINYRFGDLKEFIKQFAYLNLNRMMVVGKNGKVIEGFGVINDPTPLKYVETSRKLANAKSF